MYVKSEGKYTRAVIFQNVTAFQYSKEMVRKTIENIEKGKRKSNDCGRIFVLAECTEIGSRITEMNTALGARPVNCENRYRLNRGLARMRASPRRATTK